MDREQPWTGLGGRAHCDRQGGATVTRLLAVLKEGRAGISTNFLFWQEHSCDISAPTGVSVESAAGDGGDTGDGVSRARLTSRERCSSSLHLVTSVPTLDE